MIVEEVECRVVLVHLRDRRRRECLSFVLHFAGRHDFLGYLAPQRLDRCAGKRAELDVLVLKKSEVVLPEKRQQIVVLRRRQPPALHQREEQKQLSVFEPGAKHQLANSVLVEQPGDAVGGSVRLFHQWSAEPSQI